MAIVWLAKQSKTFGFETPGLALYDVCQHISETSQSIKKTINTEKVNIRKIWHKKFLRSSSNKNSDIFCGNYFRRSYAIIYNNNNNSNNSPS